MEFLSPCVRRSHLAILRRVAGWMVLVHLVDIHLLKCILDVSRFVCLILFHIVLCSEQCSQHLSPYLI